MNKLLKVLLVSTTLTLSSAVLMACDLFDTRTRIQFRVHNNNPILQRHIDKFNKENKDYKAELLISSGYTAVEDENKKSFSTGKKANLTVGYPDSFELYNTYGDHVLDLTKYITDPEVGFTKEQLDDFVPDYYAEGSSYVKSGTYSIALSKSTEFTYYNKTFFEKHGLSFKDHSWEEFITLGKKIIEFKKQDLKEAGKTDDQVNEIMKNFYPIGYDSDANLLIRSIGNDGGYTKFVTENGVKKGVLTFIDFGKEGEEAPNKTTQDMLKYFAKLNKEHILNTKKGNAGKYLSSKFQNGDIIITIGSSAGAKHNLITNPEIGKTAVTKAPQFNNGTIKPINISQGPSVAILKSENEKQNKGAWLLLKSLYEPAFQAEYNISSSYSPIVKSAYKDKNYTDFISSETTDLETQLKKDVYKLYEDMATNNDPIYLSPVFKDSARARKLAELLIHGLYSNEEYKAITLENLEKESDKVNQIIKKIVKAKYEEIFN